MIDNAAVRNNFASAIYESGVKEAKRHVLDALPVEFSSLHNAGAIHIHDLEAFGKIYNCCTPCLGSYLQSLAITSATDAGMIQELFAAIEGLVTQLAVAQSGGIGFGNFDIDLGTAISRLGIECSDSNRAVLADAVRAFVKWVNVTHTRFCREPYYITLNIGLGTGEWERAVSESLLSAFELMPSSFTRPNIVFKVSRETNSTTGSANHDLFMQALRCTARRMVPTYLLMESSANEACDPLRLNIMGCRTRVYANIAGVEGTIGRGNIGCVSINIPRIALETRRLTDFEALLCSRMKQCFEILEIRRDWLLDSAGSYIGFVLDNGIWGDVSTVQELVEQGTYSIGFIGIAEAVDVLMESDDSIALDAGELGLRIVSLMADAVGQRREHEGRNYSFLASPGEMISGRFCELDARAVPHRVQDKGFYTNSFHVPVDAGVPVFEKIAREAPFHALCNGGAISYVEFSSALIDNVEALEDALSFATRAGSSYIGFNFPLDTCRACGHVGTFDNCPECGSDDVLRIRRVSGYLEDLSHFTSGKKAEAGFRVANQKP